MRFEILGEISDIETFASGSGIREIARLRRVYGRGRWRKRKGTLAYDYLMAPFILPSIGCKEFKIKSLL
jgi:hypothetical protein